MWGLFYKNTGPWGPGGGRLTSLEADSNTYTLQQQIVAKAQQGVSVVDVVQSGNQFYFQLSDHSYIGPVTIPTLSLNPRGAWTPLTVYHVNDLVQVGQKVYLVVYAHTSAATFDPHANDGAGHNYYSLLIDMTGTGLDHLDELLDVSLHGPSNGQVLTYSGGFWINAAPTGGGGGGGGGKVNLFDLEDVNGTFNGVTSYPPDGDILYYDGSESLFDFKPNKLSNLSDCAPTLGSSTGGGPHYGDFLYYDDTTGNHKWYNGQTLRYQQMTAINYTFSVYDSNKLFDFTGGSPGTSVVIPTHAHDVSANGGLSFNDGCRIGVRQYIDGQVTVTGMSGVSLIRPGVGKLAKTRGPGSIIWMQQITQDNWVIYGDLADDPSWATFTDAQLGGGIDLTGSNDEVFTNTPASSWTASIAAGATYARKLTLMILTSGTTSYTLTFGSGFRSTGTLTTGTATGKMFVISFVGDGSFMNEVSRTTAM